MFKIKIFSSIIIFSCLLIITSIIKNETRDIEKKIFKLNKKIIAKERDLNETQLDYSYLTSPSIIELKLDHLDNYKYLPMEYSNIFFGISNFIELQSKYVKEKNENEKKTKKE